MGKTDKLGTAQRAIYEYLVRVKMKPCVFFISPTEIGLYFDRHCGQASSWASPKLKALVKKGLVERNGDGWYRAI